MACHGVTALPRRRGRSDLADGARPADSDGRVPGTLLLKRMNDFTWVNRSPVGPREPGLPATHRYVPYPRPLGTAQRRTEPYR
jgi:hypothetical protein